MDDGMKETVWSSVSTFDLEGKVKFVSKISND